MNELYVLDLVLFSSALTAFIFTIVMTISGYKAGFINKDFIKRTTLPYVIINTFLLIIGFLFLLYA